MISTWDVKWGYHYLRKHPFLLSSSSPALVQEWHWKLPRFFFNPQMAPGGGLLQIFATKAAAQSAARFVGVHSSTARFSPAVPREQWKQAQRLRSMVPVGLKRDPCNNFLESFCLCILYIDKLADKTYKTANQGYILL